MSLAKLTSLSTQTLSLLLERQRLHSLSPAGASNGTNTSLHIPQITRNLAQLRSGIIELESTNNHSEAVVLLRNQYTRMCSMVGTDATIEPLPEPALSREEEEAESWKPPGGEKLKTSWPIDGEHTFTPYTDDPEAGRDPALLLQEQRRLLDGTCLIEHIIKSYRICGSPTDQDVHLDTLTRSITRQRDLSMQINDELEVHTGLLEELDHDLDNTGDHLGRARQRLGRVTKGAKEHGECKLTVLRVSLTDECYSGSTLTIGFLILVLLILIIVFKT